MQRVCVIEGITNLLFIASAPQCCSSPGMHPPSLSKLIRDRTELVILKCPRSIHLSGHDVSPCSQPDSARFTTNNTAASDRCIIVDVTRSRLAQLPHTTTFSRHRCPGTPYSTARAIPLVTLTAVKILRERVENAVAELVVAIERLEHGQTDPCASVLAALGATVEMDADVAGVRQRPLS